MLKKTVVLFISLVIVLVLFWLAGCKPTTAKQAISQNNSDVSSIASASSKTESKITSETESSVTSEESIPEEFKDMKDITPDSIKGKGFRILKNPESCLSIVLVDGKSYTLGESFGGYGVVDIKYYEKSNYLLYTYSSGSGIHRSNIGIFDLNQKVTIFNSVEIFNIDIMLSETDKEGIYDVNEAKVSAEGGFCDLILTKGEMIGTLSITDSGISFDKK